MRFPVWVWLKLSSLQGDLKLTESIMKKIDEGYKVCSVFLNLSKAFDTINHKIIVFKLNSMGIRGFVGDLISSYLSKRKQFVAIGKKTSKTLFISIEVPQG